MAFAGFVFMCVIARLDMDDNEAATWNPNKLTSIFLHKKGLKFNKINLALMKNLA